MSLSGGFNCCYDQPQVITADDISDEAKSTALEKFPHEMAGPFSETTSQLENDGDDEPERSGVCSLVWRASRLGMAFYDPLKRTVYLSEDVSEGNDFEYLRLYLMQIQPQYVLVSSRTDDQVFKLLDEFVCAQIKMKKSQIDEKETSSDQLDDGTGLVGFVKCLPAKDFDPTTAKRLIYDLKLSQVPSTISEEDRAQFFESWLQLSSNTNMLQSFGALLSFLSTNSIKVAVDPYCGLIDSIELCRLDQLVLVSETCIKSLQVLGRELHPSVFKSSGSGAKEGLTLYGILKGRCKTKMGMKTLRRWFLRPICDVAILQSRLDGVSFFSEPARYDLVVSLQATFRPIVSPRPILDRLKSGSATVRDWLVMVKSLGYCIRAKDLLLQEVRQHNETSHPSFIDSIDETTAFDTIAHIRNSIRNIFDVDASQSQGRFTARSGIDETLDKFKQTYYGLPSFLDQVSNREKTRLRSSGTPIESCAAAYLPQLGFFLQLFKSPDDGHESPPQLDGCELVLTSGNCFFYRTALTQAMNEHFGDLLPTIVDHEAEIQRQLEELVISHWKSICWAIDWIAQLDCVVALGQAAAEHGWIRPEFVEESVIEVVAGRHPLQQLCCEHFVANDFESGQFGGRVKLLTGPNASGKSVYLKQVGLIVYMAHVGLFVPAEKCRLGSVDRIYTRIRSLDSVETGRSTFMNDLGQMAVALNNATPRSLVIVDEFGKGTECLDGMSLMVASLQYWLGGEPTAFAGNFPPHVLFSTHFAHNYLLSMLTKGPHLRFLCMDVLLQARRAASDKNEALAGRCRNQEHSVYFSKALKDQLCADSKALTSQPDCSLEVVLLYKVVDGVCNNSYALNVAASCGIPDEIVERASLLCDRIEECRGFGTAGDSRCSSDDGSQSAASVLLPSDGQAGGDMLWPAFGQAFRTGGLDF